MIDPVFMKAIKNGLLIVVLSIGLQLPFSLGLALLVRRKLPGRVFFRTIFFLPYVFSEVITGIIWTSMFKPDPQFGLINAILTSIPGVGKKTAERIVMELRDRLPPGAAQVRVLIESTDGEQNWTTVAVSTDVISASLNALVDSVQYKLVLDERSLKRGKVSRQ